MPGVILSYGMVCAGFLVIIMLLQKDLEGKIRNFGIKEGKKVVEQGNS